MKSLITALFVVLALSSCGKKNSDNGGPTPVPSSPLVANWFATSYNGAPENNEALAGVLILKSDGSFLYQNGQGDWGYGPEASSKGTYVTNDNKLSLTYNWGVWGGTYQVSGDGATLTLVGRANGATDNTITYRKVSDDELAQIRARHPH